MMSFSGAQTQTTILAAVGGSRVPASAPTGMTFDCHSQVWYHCSGEHNLLAEA